MSAKALSDTSSLVIVTVSAGIISGWSQVKASHIFAGMLWVPLGAHGPEDLVMTRLRTLGFGPGKIANSKRFGQRASDA
jgi:hypothetical protein